MLALDTATVRRERLAVRAIRRANAQAKEALRALREAGARRRQEIGDLLLPLAEIMERLRERVEIERLRRARVTFALAGLDGEESKDRVLARAETRRHGATNSTRR